MGFDLSEVLNYTLILPLMVPHASQQQIFQERDRLRLLLDVNNAVVSTLSLRELLLGRWAGGALSELHCAVGVYGVVGGHERVAF